MCLLRLGIGTVRCLEKSKRERRKGVFLYFFVPSSCLTMYDLVEMKRHIFDVALFSINLYGQNSGKEEHEDQHTIQHFSRAAWSTREEG